MTLRDAFAQTWGSIILWIVENPFWLLCAALVVIGLWSLGVWRKHRRDKAKTKTTASATARKTAAPKTLNDHAKEMIVFFIATMDAAGKPGLSGASFDSSIKQTQVHITRGDPCWQASFTLADSPWYRCLIAPDGKWTIIGHIPSFDIEETINGPMKAMNEEWLDALLEACALTLERHAPDKVDELVRIASGED